MNQPVDSRTGEYLRAMNIDLWVARDKVASASAVTGKTAGESNNARVQSISSWSAAELPDRILQLKVRPAGELRQAELLVVTESPEPDAACMKLMSSMFAAIKLDESQWLQAGIVGGDTSVGLTRVIDSVKPKAVVLMADAHKKLDALDRLRGIRHQVSDLQPFFVMTFGPVDLLDNPDAKRPAWEDLKQLHQWLS